MFKRQSIRYRINFTIALTLLAVTIVFGIVLTIYETQRRDVAVRQIKLSLNDLTLQYSKQLGNEIFASQIIAIRETMADIMKRESILAITAYDEFGSMLVSTDDALKKNLTEKQVEVLASASASTLQEWNGQSVLSFISPIMAYGEQVGFWQIHYSLATMERQTLEIVFIFAALILSLSILIGLFLNVILVRFILNPVYMLRDTMQHIQGRETEQKPGRAFKDQSLEKMVQAFDELPDNLVLSHATDNEISSLAYAFQQLLFALKNAYIGIRTDALTELNNRMKLDEALENEVNRAQRYQSTFSIIMLDIDYFKKVNDTYGHLAGDNVLKKIADLLKMNLRKTDVPGRWGGEEFLILLPQQNKTYACMIAEKLRKTIETSEFPDVGIITASFGLTEYASEDVVNSLIKRADDALYRAKELGRNRVEEG